MSDDIALRDIEQQRNEIAHGKNLLRIMIQRRQKLEEKAAMMGSSTDPALYLELEDIREEIKRLEENIASAEKQELALETSTDTDIKTEPHLDSDSNENGDTTTLFAPDWSVIRPRVRYVDANLAYRFADATGDVNILLSFMTLFLGASISFATSFAISLGNSPASTQSSLFEPALLGTSTVFCIILTGIFGYLTRRASRRATEVKGRLFFDNEEKQENEQKEASKKKNVTQ